MKTGFYHTAKLHFKQKISRVLRITFLTLAMIQLISSKTNAEEPNPFRRDVVKGRNFEYNDRSFIHRFSYRTHPDWQRYWDIEQQGFISTAGSTKSDEMYIDCTLLKDIPFDKHFFGILRYRRGEDFDGEFDYFLTGIGLKLNEQWSVGAYGSVLERKENIDLYCEIKWQGSNADRARFVLVMPDYLYNKKIHDSSNYNDSPWAYFVDGLIGGPGKSYLYSWFNWTPRVRMNFPEDGKQFDYNQIEGGLRAWAPLSGRTGVQIALEGQTGKRNARAISTAFTDPVDMDRAHLSGNAELHRQISASTRTFAGMRYFFLTEDYNLTARPEDSGSMKRREPMLYTGMEWRLQDKIRFMPAFYASVLDNYDYDPLDPEEQRKFRRFVGKLNLPVEYRFSENAAASFSAGLQTPPRGLFGGFNVQFLVNI